MTQQSYGPPVDRRGLLGAIAAVPILGSVAASPAAGAPNDTPAETAHDRIMKIPGFNMYGSEQIAMLLYPGFTSLDLVGPYFFFGCMMGATVRLVTNQPSLAPVKSDLGMEIVPSVTMADCPTKVTVIFVPGGSQGTIAAMQDPGTLAFVQTRAAEAQLVSSVCTGSLILAAAGLLHGKRATSHWAARDALSDFGATPVNQRVVTDGNVMTGAGVSAGLDLALTIVSTLRGRAYAEALMLQAEYAPVPPFEGGTLERTDPAIGAVMKDMLSPIGVEARRIARNRT